MENKLIIGTRRSKLALWQANWVKTALLAVCPNLTIELSLISTKGDIFLDGSLAVIGGKGLFTLELEQAMIKGHIDLAVHSLKDVPAVLPKELVVGAIMERADARDVLVCPRYKTLLQLPSRARIGTSSLRRQAQLQVIRPDLVIVPVRGNVQTRLEKLKSEHLDAVILAKAGLDRLGLSAEITQVFSINEVIPAAGQGALAVECCADNGCIRALLQKINHEPTAITTTAERSFLDALQGGCQVPIGIHGRLQGQTIHLQGIVADDNGVMVYRGSCAGDATEPERLGRRLAGDICRNGGYALVKAMVEKGVSL